MTDAPNGDASERLPPDIDDAQSTDRRAELFIDDADRPRTAVELGKQLAKLPTLFNRGVPVRLVEDEHGKRLIAEPLTVTNTIIEAQRVCRPWKDAGDRRSERRRNVTLPKSVAELYLADPLAWGLPVLDGITSAPLLSDDGTFRVADGYDVASRMYCHRIPAVEVPERPTKEEATTALLEIRRFFSTFPYADARRTAPWDEATVLVDTQAPPGLDESTCLVALLTAVCRPSLVLAPAFMFRAPLYSGAGTGKGLLVRVICEIAFALPPHAMTTGGNNEELEKRLVAALIGASPVVYIDNVNGKALRSDLLASAITERPAHVRPLGSSTTRALNPSAWIAVTGNGVTLAEDLARRFMVVELDAGVDSPEERPFIGDILREARARRAELLSYVLTIWRWGRQTQSEIKPGLPLGSFSDWARWCRDPLVALGCVDPVRRIADTKTDDQDRDHIAEVYAVWDRCHGSREVPVSHIHADVLAAIDPSGRSSRQNLNAFVSRLVGTRVAGFVMTRRRKTTHWGMHHYSLQPSSGRQADQLPPKVRPEPEGQSDNFASIEGDDFTA